MLLAIIAFDSKLIIVFQNMYIGGFVCYLIFRWWYRLSALFYKTNIVHMKTSVSE